MPVIVQAVDAAQRRRGSLATGWPFVRWIRRFRPDPLRRLRLPETPQPSVRTSRPEPTEVQRAQVATAARALADRAAEGLPAPWPRLVRDAATQGEDELPDRLDRAVSGTDLHVGRPRWWRAAAFLQRVFAAATIVGMLWLLALAVLGYLHIDEVVPLPELWDVPIPTLAPARRHRGRHRLRLRLQARERGKRPAPRAIRGPIAAQTDRGSGQGARARPGRSRARELRRAAQGD